jgi:O-antigen/teichoic acid export membrane protein
MSLFRSIAKILFPSTSKYEKSIQPLSLRQNFSWIFVGNIIYATCQWGTLVAIAKLGTQEMVGQFTLGQAIIAPIILLFNLDLRGIQATDARQQYSFSHYFQLRLISTFLAMVVVIAVIFIGGYKEVTGLIIFLVGLAKGMESISDVFYGLLQQKEKMDNVAQSIILRNIISIFSLIIILYLTKNIVLAIAGFTVAGIGTLFLYDIPINNRFLGQSITKTISQFPAQYKRLGDLVWLALPGGLIMMFISLSINMPRYFLERYIGEKELGIFAAIAYLPIAGVIVISALGQSALSPLSKYYSTSDTKEFKKLLFKLINIACGLGLIGFVIVFFVGKEILTLVYSPEYSERTDVFNLLMLWGGLHYIGSFLGIAAAAARYFKSSLFLSVIKVVINVITCFWLVSTYGLKGGAIVSVIDEFVKIIGTSIILIHALNKIEKLKKI